MNPWIVISLIAAAVVFLIDYLLRRKKWTENTKTEKVSLIVNMVSVGVYCFLSALGMLWGIVGNTPETAFGDVLYEATLMLAGVYFIVAIIATVGSFILRKTGKTKASIWINIIALAYGVVVMLVNYLAGILL